MEELLELQEAQRRLQPFAQRYLGVRPIPLDHVVGTDSRAGDFDRRFQPRRRDVRDRWAQVAGAFLDGAFPPIVAVKLGQAYFVVDGHHRVAVARARGMETIDAEVTEQRAYWQLRADADETDLLRGERHRLFMEASGLGAARPYACISFSLPQGYDEVLESVESHGYRLMREHGRILEPEEIAGDWYDRVYLGVHETVQQVGLEPLYERGDLFLCLTQRRRELRVRDADATIADAARSVLAGDLERSRSRVRRLFSR
jgi:hypothetical protein